MGKLPKRIGPYWEEHSDYPVADWQREVANDDTRAGYWEWVHDQIEYAGQ